MQTTTEASPVLEKTIDLCQTIVGLPEFQSIRLRIDQFMVNDTVRGQYEVLGEKGQFLQHKQQQGLELSPEEVADFESLREKFFADPVARGFMEAQQEMHEMQESVMKHVGKTFELGRVPTPEDFAGSCGSGCGCH